MSPWGEGLDPSQPRDKAIIGTVVKYQELLLGYTCAMKEVQTKFDVLNTEFKVRNQRNPISSVTTRLKSTASITEKLNRRGLPVTLESMEKHLNDVAGVRVICSYQDDIYRIANSLLGQDDVKLIEKKDYIAEPKPNGYRSLHLIITVPVFFAQKRRRVKVEVQIRTIAMDFWASLEHQMKYKQELPNQEAIADELKSIADAIQDTDLRMLRLRRRIEQSADTPTEEELLLERFSRVDLTMD
ncbi:MAG: GTP pyrophosphokinase family protein [Ruminiclostridium sp.]|nr:GTP pyrophosphokinase family protein [Ruminiclostridium sp.]